MVYRTAQEALNNALKHSGARHLGLLLQHNAQTLTLTVTDDGCGLPPPDQRPHRFGLPGLHERTSALGGARRGSGSALPGPADRAGPHDFLEAFP